VAGPSAEAMNLIHGLTIRDARVDDLARLTAIYNHYGESSQATFDERPSEPQDRRAWFGGFRTTGPHRLLVAESEGQVIGYASSSPYRDHPAFRATIETSVYVAATSLRRGVGKALYGELFSRIGGEDLHRALAGIALPNPASIALHERLGFRRVGVFDEYARKNGQRISSLWMEKALDGSW
jgi:phosphinothricin acetyltransferase